MDWYKIIFVAAYVPTYVVTKIVTFPVELAFETYDTCRAQLERIDDIRADLAVNDAFDRNFTVSKELWRDAKEDVQSLYN